MDINDLNDIIELKELKMSDLNRSEKRALVLHVLYSLEMIDYKKTAYEIFLDYNEQYLINIEYNDPLIAEIQEIVSQNEIIDEELRPFFKKWHLDRIGIIVKLILRYAIWELKKEKTDVAVIINEAIELAKGFAENDSYKFVNGVLDMWIKKRKNLK